MDIITGTETLTRSLPGTLGEKLRSEVQHCPAKAEAPCWNLNKSQQVTIKELRSDPKTIILPADKGNATVLIDRKDYDLTLTLLDATSFQAIKRNPTMKIEQKVTEVLRSLEKKGKLPSDLRKKVQNQHSSTP